MLLEAVEHGHTGNVPIVRRRVLGLCTAVNLQGAGMTDGWEPPSEAECQACWDGLKAKLAAAEKSKAEWMIEWEGMNAAATDMLINSTHEVVVKERKRIAELEAEIQHLNEAQVRQVIGLQAEVKRLTAVAAYCQYNCASGRDSESYSLCPDCPAECVNYPGPERPQAAGPAVPVSPEGKYGTVYGLRPMDHKARKHDPISPADPLERA